MRLLGAPGFAVILLEESLLEWRDALRDRLIADSIYPAILWPMHEAETGRTEVGFSRRMLALHVDYRYSGSDMVRLQDAVGRAYRRDIHQ